MDLNSALYQIKIWHDRREPKQYAFSHHVFMFYLDVDEIDTLAKRFFLFGHRQARVYNFCDEDHISLGHANVKDNVCAYLRSQGVSDVIERVFLLTNVRVLGYIFNPVSFYCCFDSKGAPVAVVCEIGNTFGELKYFLLTQKHLKALQFKDQQTKYYYISPFTDMDHTLDFNVEIPGPNLKIIIDVLKGGHKYFYSSMMGKRLEFTSANLWRMTLLYPFMTIKVIALIHWHAFILHFIKGLNYHRKEETPQWQQKVYRPWRGTSGKM